MAQKDYRVFQEKLSRSNREKSGLKIQNADRPFSSKGGENNSHLSPYSNENQRPPIVSGWVVRSYKKRDLKMHLKCKILFLRKKKKINLCLMVASC